MVVVSKCERSTQPCHIVKHLVKVWSQFQIHTAAMWLELLLGFGLFLLYIYRWITGSWDEFKKRGIPYAEPSFPWGSSNARTAMMGEINFFDVDKPLARTEFKDTKIWGYYMMAQPTLVINDETLAKHILVKDFDHFTDLRCVSQEELLLLPL